VHDSPCREEVMDLPEIIVLKIKVNDIRIKMKNLPKALTTVQFKDAEF
jgi:hypothetical protein